jgi:ATPase subunit of ABC transporter with duplicated ATPase domains
MTVGNYDFWYDYTQLRQRQIREQNKKAEIKIKELQSLSRGSAQTPPIQAGDQQKEAA